MNMVILNTIIGLMLTLAFSTNVLAISSDVLCPEEISVTQRVDNLKEGWTAYDEQPQHRFLNVLFSEGDPGKQVILVPTQQKKRMKGQTSTWLFGPSVEGYWVSCEYTGTSVVVFKKLPENIRSCIVEYDANFSAPVARSVKCSQ